MQLGRRRIREKEKLKNLPYNFIQCLHIPGRVLEMVLTSIDDRRVCVCVFACTLFCQKVMVTVVQEWSNTLLNNIPSSLHSSTAVQAFLHITTTHLNTYTCTHTCSCYSVVPAVRSQVLVHPPSPHLISIKWHHSVSWSFSREVTLPWNEY